MKKTILITGAGTGIGKDAALRLAERGHYVIATTETELQAKALEEEITGQKIRMEVFRMDIRLKTHRAKIEKYDLDVLINNAGIGESGSLAEIPSEKIRDNFEVNVFCAIELTQLALKKMLQNNKGTVLFISSLGGRITMPFLGAYSMTKFALSSGAEAMRKEIHLVRKNVHVSLIEPGAYHTGFNQKNFEKKYEWMDENSVFFPIIDRLHDQEERRFSIIESKSTKSIVRKIVRASEARKPRLRYSAPAWQYIGSQILRIFGK